jgi:hypothetical protein
MSSQYGAKYGGYIKEFLDDKSVSGLLNNRLLYHDYGSDRFKGELVEHRQTLSEQIAKYPGWKLWMSEDCVMTGSKGKGGGRRNLTMDTALDVARIIHLDLTLVDITAWQWWTAVSPVDSKDEKARRVVAVYINMGTAPEFVQPEFALGARRWRLKSITPFVTTPREGGELKQYPDSAPGKPLEIPPRSVVTFVSQFTG